MVKSYSPSSKEKEKWQFCIDFRKLDVITVKDTFPPPQVTDLMNNLTGHQYFSTPDIASRYWQFSVDESSKENCFCDPREKSL